MTPNAPGLWKARSGRMVLVFDDAYLIYTGLNLLAGGLVTDFLPVEDWRPFTEPSFPPIPDPELRCLVDVGSGPEWAHYDGIGVVTRGSRTYGFKNVTVVEHAKNDAELVEMIDAEK